MKIFVSQENYNSKKVSLELATELLLIFKGEAGTEAMTEAVESVEALLQLTKKETIERCAGVVDAHAISEMEGRAGYTVKQIEAVATAIRLFGKGGGE